MSFLSNPFPVFFFLSHSVLPGLICSLNRVLLPCSLSVSGCLVVYEKRWRTAGARPAQNTREVIQFGVGSKLDGRLCTAWCGAGYQAGWMHIILPGCTADRAKKLPWRQARRAAERERVRGSGDWDLTHSQTLRLYI